MWREHLLLLCMSTVYTAIHAESTTGDEGKTARHFEKKHLRGSDMSGENLVAWFAWANGLRVRGLNERIHNFKSSGI